MSIEFLPPDVDELTPRITVIGVGGAGGNAIANMIKAEVQGVDFLVANTDAQALKSSPAEQRIQLGAKITQGLGAGSRPEIGRAAAEETIEAVERALDGAHMCFIAAGMGGGTGTGAAPVIAKAARDRGILTVGVVTKPFSFEGSRRMKSADAGIAELQKHVDTLIVIPNQNLFLIANADTTFKEAFAMADEVLQQGVRGITDLMVMPGLINLDFADVRSVMGEMGKAMMGTGEADGDNRAIQAAEKAIANPLLDGVSMKGAKGVIISITGGEDMRLLEVDEAANHIRELVDPDANIIWGSAFNDNLSGKIRVSVVATGIEADVSTQAEPARVLPFATRRSEPASAPVAEAPAAPVAIPGFSINLTPPEPAAEADPVQETAEADDALELDTVAEPEPEAAEADELVLGEDSVAADDEPVAEGEPKTEAPKRRWLYSDDGDEPVTEAPKAPRVKVGGGTLFERMSNATRGATRTEPDGEGMTDIPRFLNRQNNQ
ncbi:cell division protein FtsZ [Sphingomonas gilva]|uniref:Cell division protein FtsZ n=1 Tax=Sphingomonas gilva TaxID=2305907 RepID=A0A396RRT3_9SPHN|nr:cell division protein FtsZ [Sphingomonas gilva]RHW18042.1 cell division protein FtsZ [Sphingomonas gilva]